MITPTRPDRTAATSTTPSLPTSRGSSTSSRISDRTREPDGRAVHFWRYLILSATCAILVPLTVFAVSQLTDDGPVRLLLIWSIALLTGSAVYASAAATDAAHRRK